MRFVGEFCGKTSLHEQIKSEDICVPCKHSQRGEVSREELMNKWIRWPVLWIRSFPSHPHHHPMGSWIKWPWRQGWKLYMGSAIDFHSPKLTWLWPLLSAQSANNRDQDWEPDMALLLEMISHPAGVKWIKLGLFHYERGNTLFLLE